MTSDEIRDWLKLLHIPQLGPTGIYNLVSHFESVKNIFSASLEELESLHYLKKNVAFEIKNFKKHILVNKELDFIHEKNIHVVSFLDTHYPQSLKNISYFPPLLFCLGNLDLLNLKPLLGVVGSRDASEYGLMALRKILPEIINQQVGIVSGFARGIDIESHHICLKNGKPTLAVLAGGFLHIHPGSNKNYIQPMIENGLFVSEFTPYTESFSGHFPRRNRIISGLSRGVLVIQAGIKSGAMITAEYALDQNRDLFAIPGLINSDAHLGCNLLIQKGAKLVQSASDILNEWSIATREIPQIKFECPDENQVYHQCQKELQTPDQLIVKTGLAPERVFMLLSKMELEGRLIQVPGRRYQSV